MDSFMNYVIVRNYASNITFGNTDCKQRILLFAGNTENADFRIRDLLQSCPSGMRSAVLFLSISSGETGFGLVRGSSPERCFMTSLTKAGIF